MHRPFLVFAAILVLVISACSPAPAVPRFNLDVTVDGDGTVSSDPVGINTNGAATAEFVEGTVVTLTATPSDGSAFVGFSGAVCEAGSMADTCIITVTEDTSVIATFEVEQFLVAASGLRLDLMRVASGSIEVVDSAVLPGDAFDVQHGIFGLAMHPVQPWLYVASFRHSNWGDAQFDVFELDTQSGFTHVSTQLVSSFPEITCTGCATTEIVFSNDGSRLYVNEDNNDNVLTFAVDASTGALSFLDLGLDAPVAYQGLAVHPTAPYLYNGLNVLELVDGLPVEVSYDFNDGGNSPRVFVAAGGTRLITTVANETIALMDLEDPAAPAELDRFDVTYGPTGPPARALSADIASERVIVVGNDLVTVFGFASDTFVELSITSIDIPVGVSSRVYRNVAWVPATDLAVATWFSGENATAGVGGYTVIEVAADGSVSVVAEIDGAGRARAILNLP
jgi:hypothetical protein